MLMLWPKGDSARTTRLERRARETAAWTRVKAEVRRRDRICRYPDRTECAGRLEVAHLHERRRSKTTGKPPADRHDARWCLLLCAKHHRAYDEHRVDLVVMDRTVGAHGPVMWE